MSFLYTQKNRLVCQNLFDLISVWSWVPKHTNLDTCQTRWSTCAVRVCALLLAAGKKVPSRSSSINCMTLATNHWLYQPKPLTCFFSFQWMNCEQLLLWTDTSYWFVRQLWSSNSGKDTKTGMNGWGPTAHIAKHSLKDLAETESEMRPKVLVLPRCWSSRYVPLIHKEKNFFLMWYSKCLYKATGY